MAISSWDILSGDAKPAQDILICDATGRHEAVSCADYLSALGHKVTLATIDAHSATEMGYPDRAVYRKRLYQQGVSTLPDLRITALHKDGNRLVATLSNELTGQSQDVCTDQVIVEAGTDPMAEVFFELKSQSINDGLSDVDALATYQPQPIAEEKGFTLYRIGDSVTSRSIHAAIWRHIASLSGFNMNSAIKTNQGKNTMKLKNILMATASVAIMLSASIANAGEALDRVMSSKVLKVATDANWAPQSF